MRFDAIMKELFPCAKQLMRLITGSDLGEQLRVELAETRTLVPDLVARQEGERLCHIEFQSTSDADMPDRMAEYYLALRKAHRQPPRQFVVYVGNRPMTMANGFQDPDMQYRYGVVDLRDLAAGPLLASDCLEDNLLAVLCQGGAERAAIHEVLSRIARLEGQERDNAVSKLLLLSGLRRVREVVQEEMKAMPIEWDIEENWFLKDVFEKGEARGEARGEVKGRQSVLRQLIEHRFGPLPSWALDRLAHLSPEALDRIGIRVLDTETLEDVFDVAS